MQPGLVTKSRLGFISVRMIQNRKFGNGWKKIRKDCKIFGSIISAQTYGFPVVSMVPVPGYERKPPSEKLMRADKFNIYFGY